MTEQEVRQQSEAAFGQWKEQWEKNSKFNGEIYKRDGNSHKDLLNHGIGRQLLVVATGYSLEREIDTIKQYRDKCDIACVDKSFGVLMDHGIKPDFVVIADANVSYSDWAERHIEQTEGVTLIANVNCNTEWTKNWKGKIIFYVNKDNIETEKIYMELSGCRELIPASSNVGNTVVVFFGQVCNYDRYLLIGYDYSWAPGTNYYAFNDNDKRYWMRHMFAIGITGELCYTSQNLHFSARWLVEYIQKSMGAKPVFNCSGAGVLTINPRKLAVCLDEFTPRAMTEAELNGFYNSRINQESFPYSGPDDLMQRLNKHKYIAGIRIDYLPADIQPVPGAVA